MVITTYNIHDYIQRFMYTYILQGVCHRPCGHHHGGAIFSMGVGHPPHQLISNTVNVLLIHYILWLNFRVMQLFLFILT